jgi:hypothetical protein
MALSPPTGSHPFPSMGKGSGIGVRALALEIILQGDGDTASRAYRVGRRRVHPNPALPHRGEGFRHIY